MTIAMGVIANTPLALAAGLGINGAVAFGLVLTQGLTPAGAMGVIVLEGIIVTVLVLVGLREAIMRAVPLSLKRAIGVGIGLFILFIGFIDAGHHRQDRRIVGREPGAGHVRVPDEPAHFLFWFGLLLTVGLWARKVPAALLISILVTTIIAIVGRRPAVADDTSRRRPASRRSVPSTSGTSSSCSVASPRSSRSSASC